MSFDQSEFSTDESASEVLSEMQDQDTKLSGTLDEAVKRIEEANLLRSLITHEVFGANSARPEVLNAVKKRLKDWAINELEVLLGMKQSAPVVKAIAQIPIFDNEEQQALKALAARVLKRDVKQAVVIREPEVKPIMADTSSGSVQPMSKPQLVAKKASPKPAPPPKAPAAINPSTGKPIDRGTASVRPSGVMPIPQPTAAQAMSVATSQVSAGADGFNAVLSGNTVHNAANAKTASNLISAAIQAMTQGNTVAELGSGSNESGDINDRF